MFLALWHYLRGYVIIKVSGFSVERFINLAAMKGVFLWDIKYLGTGTIMKVGIKDFKRLGDCARRTKCRVKIIKKKGFPFTISKYKKRKFYTAGLFIFVFALYVMSSFVWTVNIKGNERVAAEEIMEFCKKEGLYIGQLKFRLDNKTLTKKIIAGFNDISWVAIVTKGTDVTITVVETLPKVTVEDKESAVDIISKKACVIESISVSRGTPLVKAGDVVDEGDVLVSSILTIKDMDTEIGRKYVYSKAEIRGKSFYEKEYEYSLKYLKKVYTGEKKTDKILIVGDYLINPVSPVLNGLWEKKDEDEKVFKAGKVTLPFKIITESFYEYKEEETVRTEKEAKELIFNDIEKQRQEFEFNEAEIVDIKTEFFTDEGKTAAKVVYIVIEDIGMEKIFDEKGEADING